MVEDFGMPSSRLCEIFHTVLEIFFDQFQALIEFKTWLPFFEQFAAAFALYGSPYKDLVGLVDGNFLAVCKPGGLGNRRSRLDQGQFFTGEKARHGIKHLGAFFPNGMIALAGPFFGNVHDSRMMRESGWMALLRSIAEQNRRRYKLFRDAAFGFSNFVQAMLKDAAAATPIGRAFNAMSRIRIHIENAFGYTSNLFTFLAFHRSVKVGGRNTEKMYKVATILMNMRTTFYGNQFTDALGHPLHMTIEELIALCPGFSAPAAGTDVDARADAGPDAGAAAAAGLVAA